MDKLPNDILRRLIAQYLPIHAIGTVSSLSQRFHFLATDESLFALIALRYSLSLTSENKRSYTWKDIVRVIHHYQVRFSKTVHLRYGLRFGNHKVKLLNLESNILISFNYQGLMLDPHSIGKTVMIENGHAQYTERVDILHFAEPHHDFFTTPVEQLKPLYRPCLTNKDKKKIPPTVAFRPASSGELTYSNYIGRRNDYVSDQVHLGKPLNMADFNPGDCTTLSRSGIILFDGEHPVVAWDIDSFRHWIDKMTQACHQEMHRLYQKANLAYARPLYYKITDVNGKDLVLRKRGGDERGFLLMAFRSSKSRVRDFRNLEIIKDPDGCLLLKANLNLDFLPIRKLQDYEDDHHSPQWSPVKLCPVIQPDGSCRSLITKKKEVYEVLHPYDYFYGMEIRGQRYRKTMKIEIPESFRRTNKLPASVKFTPTD